MGQRWNKSQIRGDSKVESTLMRCQKAPFSKSSVFILAVASTLENGLIDQLPPGPSRASAGPGVFHSTGPQ